MSYHYHTCCINSTAINIYTMVDNAIDITYCTMLKHCSGLLDWAERMGYVRDGRSKGLTLKNDWGVSFHRSKYRGRRCYYVCHSAIEYIWTELDNLDSCGILEEEEMI